MQAKGPVMVAVACALAAACQSSTPDSTEPSGAGGASSAGTGGSPTGGTASGGGAPSGSASTGAGGANTGGGSSSSPSGEAMPTGDLPGWHLIFSDDFTTGVPLGAFPSAVSSKWSAYADGWKDTSQNGTYYPSKVISISGGMMNLYLHTENGVHMVSAPVPKLPGAMGSAGGLLYGRYVVRFRADPVPGYKTAWLLWPDSEVWPGDGEIDFPEGDLDGTIHAFMHRQDGTSGSDQDAYPTQVTYSAWHTAVIEWTDGQCRFLLDGMTIGTSTSRVPNTPMHWVLQTETALSGTPPSSSAAGNVQIDWVVVYVPT